MSRAARDPFVARLGTGLRRVVVVLALVAAAMPLAGPGNAQVIAQASVVSDDPANFTPHVLDGSVKAIVQVGSQMILGGSFSQVQAASGGAVLTRNNIVAFDATTGAFSSTFVPSTDGEVTSLLVAADGLSVYAGGFFNKVNGANSKSLARISVSNGGLVAGFTPPAMDGRVKDLRLAGGRLWVAGTFALIGGQQQAALATVNPTTGAFNGYTRLTFAGPNGGGVLQVLKIDINASASRLVAIGNFTTVAGQSRPQVVMVDITGGSAALANWATQQYAPACASVFDSYMRDLDFSPDGGFFVISTTGAYGGFNGSPCDSTMRWETGASGPGIQPTWVDYTGGDTTYAVAVTGSAVYTGGHFRWQNNPFAGDSPGPGAVSREGITALDPRNGLPLAWNPGRTKGVGVFDMLATASGLWVGSDTDRIGNFEYHGRIAYFPLAGGITPPADFTGTLANHIFLAGGQVGGVPAGSILYRVNTGGPALASLDNGPAWAVDSSPADPHHNGVSNTAGWAPVPTVDGTVPASTPSAVFDSERWDPGSAPELQWDFPVTGGTPVEVRLYFANRYGGTSTVGSRLFNVSLDGTPVLTNYDIVASVGSDRGTMRSFDITSDGGVDIDFDHVVENPLINAIEIVRTDLPPPGPTPGPDDVSHRFFDGATVGVSSTLPATGIAWGSSRGSVMIDGSVFTAASDGSFVRRAFDGSGFGAATPVDTADLIVRLDDWHGDAAALTGLFFDNGRMYFTRAGSTSLYYRYFTPANNVVGALRFTASTGVTGVDFSRVSGMFLAGGRLYFATSDDGVLHRVDWSSTASGGLPVDGTATTVSGPAIDGNDWRARSLFLYTGSNLPGPNQPPTARFTSTCASLTCSFDGSGSSDPEGSIAGYAWTFGDGGTASGATTNHTYAAAGSYPVTLTVTDDSSVTGTTTQQVVVNSTAIGFVGASSVNGNATSYTVTTPANVLAGDGLLLVATANTAVTVTDPAGWQRVGAVDLGGGNGVSVAWQKVAVAADAGRPVTVALSGLAKAGVSVLAYSGTAVGAPLTSATAATETVSRTTHTTPAVSGVPAGAWVVSYWADKSSATTAWTAPAGELARTQGFGTGSGRIGLLATDSGASVPAGNRAGLTATANAASGKAVMWTFVLAQRS